MKIDEIIILKNNIMLIFFVEKMWLLNLPFHQAVALDQKDEIVA